MRGEDYFDQFNDDDGFFDQAKGFEPFEKLTEFYNSMDDIEYYVTGILFVLGLSAIEFLAY